MKKYALPLFAFLLAIAVSSFTISHKTSGKVQDNLYWYRTNTAGTLLVSSLGQNTKAGIESTTGCDDTDVDFCARAYTSPQALGTAPIPSDDQLMEKQ
ncbi:MAG TPA: hypothetical protein VNT20_19725 [Flavisolibacter sp.]|jgi:hypothetical protein|nr:hypothetical protein [Flavisolibacter sp.]